MFKIFQKFPGESEIDYLINQILNHNMTMLEKERLLNLKNWCINFKNHNESFVECGVAKGGCLILMKYLSNNNKQIFGFDSFEGMPGLTEEDEESGKQWVGYVCSGAEGIISVYNNFKKLKVPMKKVSIVKGYFENVLEKYKNKIGKIAILRLDNDWYKSTRYCLETLYEKVIPNGVVIIDDYGSFVGCRKAVDEFRLKNKILSKLHQTDHTEFYWVKE